MPGGDGTGPMRMGPMTGRGLGYCCSVAPGVRGVGGWGRGRGWRYRFWQPELGVAPARASAQSATLGTEEALVLKEQLAGLEKAFSALRSRIDLLADQEDR